MRLWVQLPLVLVLGLLLTACPAAAPNNSDGDGSNGGGNGQATDAAGGPSETLVAQHGGSTGLLTFVEVGSCFWVLGAEPNFTDIVEGVSCDEEHEYEVFANVDPPAGDWPGDEELTALAEDCSGQPFEDYVGIASEDSTWEILAVVPTEEEWGRGQQTIKCLLFDPEADTTQGSAADGGE